MPLGVDADGHQDRAGDDRAAVADLLVAGVEDQVGHLAQGPFTPGLQLGVECGGGPADLGAADLGAAELLGDGGDLAGGDALDVHLGNGELQGSLAADALLQGRGIKVDAPGLGDGQRDRAHSGQDGLGLEAVGIPLTPLGSLVGACPEGVGPFELHDLVEQEGEDLGHAVESVLGQEFPDLFEGVSLRVVGHRRSVSLGWLAPSKEPAMTCRFKANRSRGPSRAGYARRRRPTSDREITEAMMHYQKIYDFIYSFEYLSPQFTLNLADKELSQL